MVRLSIAYGKLMYELSIHKNKSKSKALKRAVQKAAGDLKDNTKQTNRKIDDKHKHLVKDENELATCASAYLMQCEE